jgi:hypothetical protein
MRVIQSGLVVIMLLSVLSSWGHAAEDKVNVLIEPIFGVGYASSSNDSGMGYHAGVRILSHANPTKRWGGEISYISPFEFKDALKHKKYISVGIMLQQILLEQFIASIGTVGYIGIDQNKNNPFGVRSELGWEPAADIVHTYAALRFELIFDVATIQIVSMSLGLKF